MLIEYDLQGKKHDKVQTAIDRLIEFEPEEGYFLAFSGGKDSQCVYELAKMAGVNFDAHYNVTSVDPPELVRFIRQNYPQVIFDYPKDKNGKRITMWSLIPQKQMPPTRLVRYCCAHLKESAGKGRLTVTGVRWAESVNRKNTRALVNIQSGSKEVREKAEELNAPIGFNRHGGVIMNNDNDEARRLVETCYTKHKILLNPIIDWTDGDVWEFLNNIAKVPHCPLYDEGFARIGCIGCPMGSPAQRAAEFARWPKFERLYLLAFEKMIQERNERKDIKQLTYFVDPQSVMDWWMEKKKSGKIDGQISMDDLSGGV